MTGSYLIEQSILALIITAQLSAPTVIVGTLAGLAIGLFQSLTQVQEQTLPLAVKILAIGLVILMTLNWMGVILFNYSKNLFNAIGAV